ncbi:hypothetical protein K474DRAFT_992611 [Panus rudis PR-1116 ss-1]|nr:hypothetical protein K474DRAFT_992611 [Panus rudis PR-1116 ss-1]
MDHFSWYDTFQAAISPCLSCLGRSSAPQLPESDDEQSHRRHARSDELEGLLADASDDAETLSLHSNIGDQGRARRKKRRPKKWIRFFGYDLFGRPPIQLPESEDEGEGDSRPRRSNGRSGDRTRTISTSTLDSDASPLDPSAIDELSSARIAETLAREEEERRAKEERRRKRRERKEAKRAALALAMAGDGEFEGFQVRFIVSLSSLSDFRVSHIRGADLVSNTSHRPSRHPPPEALTCPPHTLTKNSVPSCKATSTTLTQTLQTWTALTSALSLTHAGFLISLSLTQTAAEADPTLVHKLQLPIPMRTRHATTIITYLSSLCKSLFPRHLSPQRIL